MDLKEREDFDWFESVWILIERKKKKAEMRMRVREGEEVWRVYI